MAIIPGYEHDIFLSYAHVDNLDAEGHDGWISQFVKHFDSALRQRLGRYADVLNIFFDSRATGANFQLSEFLRAVERSALFLAVGSPSYASRDWPRQELGTFVQRIADPSRLFMIEFLPLAEDERYPSPLDCHLPLRFWRPSGNRRVPMPYSPIADGEEFRQQAHGLAEDIRARLLALRLLPAYPLEPRSSWKCPPHDAPSQEAGDFDRYATSPAGSRKTLLLAQATDDVEDEIDQLRRYLRQYDEEIVVLPQACYPQGGENFKAALAQDLAQADLFVQVLGRRAGRVPPDLPEGYTRHQLEAAKGSGVQIMQWRHPNLDIASVSDPAYVAILSSDTVVACGLEAFKRQILAWFRRPKTKPCAVRSASVFINADSGDLGVAKEIERECLKHTLTTVLPMVGPSAEANRKDLADNLIDCDMLLFIYGNTTQDWIRSQLRFFSKVRPNREAEPKLLVIYSGPPAEKPEIGVTIPNADVIDCADGWNLVPIKALISERVD